MKGLRGAIALVTGAATGIGEATVRRLRAEQAQVVAAGLQPELLAALSADTGCVGMTCDVTSESAVAGVVADTLERFGRLEILVNAAGIVHADDLGTIDDGHWQQTLEVNLTGAMRMCRAALPALTACGRGAIVNVASVAAFNASPGMASYSASKAGLVALTRSIANQYGAEGLRANCVCPGWVRTPMSESEMALVAAQRGIAIEAAFAQLGDRIALRRVALPAEIASTICFLASAEASFVTGAALVVDGGARIPATARGV